MIIKYNEYINNSINNILNNYVNNNINDKELVEKLSLNLNSKINENFLNTISGKIEDWLMNIFSYLYKNYNKIKNKLINIIKNVIKAISKFSNKYPKATKVIIILLVIFIITIFTAQSAYGATNGNIPDNDTIQMTNAIIGFIKDLMNDPNIKLDNKVGMESIAYLIDFKDSLSTGNKSDFILSDEAVAVVKSAKQVVLNILDRNDVDKFQKLVNVGEKYISYNIKDIQNISSSYTEYLLGKK